MSDVKLKGEQIRTLAALAGDGELDLTGLANAGSAGPVIAEVEGERYLVARDGEFVREANVEAWDREVVR